MHTTFYSWFGLNHALFLWINRVDSAQLDTAYLALSQAGSAATMPYWVTGALLIAWRRPKIMPLTNVAVFALGYLATLYLVPWLKLATHLPRPYAALAPVYVHVVGEISHSSSFPSGHSAFAFLLAAALGRKSSIPIRLALWMFAILVGLSRIGMGDHFPADVVGGALLGIVIAWLVRAAFSRWP